MRERQRYRVTIGQINRQPNIEREAGAGEIEMESDNEGQQMGRDMAVERKRQSG